MWHHWLGGQRRLAGPDTWWPWAMTSASPLQSPLQDSAVNILYPRHSDLWSAARKPESCSFWIEANLRPLSCLETFEFCHCTWRCPASTSVHSLPPLLPATTTTTTRCIHGYGFLEQLVHVCQNDLWESMWPQLPCLPWSPVQVSWLFRQRWRV